MRTTILLFIFVCTLQLKAQTEVIINIPDTIFYDMSKRIDISYLDGKMPGTGILYEYYGPQSIDCYQKLDKEAEKKLNTLRQKRESFNYTLIVDWQECKIISLKSYSSNTQTEKGTWTIYQISITNKNKEISIQENTNISSSGKPIIVTYEDAHGEWQATGPYNSSQVYATEKEALEELFYPKESLTFLCKRKQFNIYIINEKTENIRLNVRDFLKYFDINDIP